MDGLIYVASIWLPYGRKSGVSKPVKPMPLNTKQRASGKRGPPMPMLQPIEKNGWMIALRTWKKVEGQMVTGRSKDVKLMLEAIHRNKYGVMVRQAVMERQKQKAG